MWKGLFYCMWMQDKPLLQVSAQEATEGTGATVSVGGWTSMFSALVLLQQTY